MTLQSLYAIISKPNKTLWSNQSSLSSLFHFSIYSLCPLPPHNTSPSNHYLTCVTFLLPKSLYSTLNPLPLTPYPSLYLLPNQFVSLACIVFKFIRLIQVLDSSTRQNIAVQTASWRYIKVKTAI